MYVWHTYDFKIIKSFILYVFFLLTHKEIRKLHNNMCNGLIAIAKKVAVMWHKISLCGKHKVGFEPYADGIRISNLMPNYCDFFSPF